MVGVSAAILFPLVVEDRTGQGLLGVLLLLLLLNPGLAIRRFA